MAEQVPRFVSITAITVRHWWQVGQAVRRWRRLTAELAAAGFDLDSRAMPDRRGRRVVFVTLAHDEDSLRRSAATRAHVDVVRWTIPRKTALWSAVYSLDGWSSMSGPPSGVWSTRLGVRGPGSSP